ncbi:hypothetical protein ELH42_37240 [Rhizobium ruizarguesonis]|uniref:Peptidase inhibitor I78 family protein n=1 Tax=Rhizobium ruizarguesonis TaxID=2081791 RepID=A0AB38HRL2_9HYPH|nr:hypothetical protein ELH68_36100 [Rhizobium ruizarguesonis]TAZ88674.1 hypothetical protein ELH64_36355 [Rhizobium ruizarguesonis]TBA09946.1 hypothetical protein ELH61_36305 [Rhizobium ruizarguesonis]TBA30507.1 hypothetical protein ELH63_35580 [Rhizobium ruizarguesonis]TBA30746.1 hypothetical protein ELH62_36480 [Rhizobium ruizarguesonis]
MNAASSPCSVWFGICERSSGVGGVLSWHNVSSCKCQCDAAAAQTLIGKPQPTDEEARRVTGATTARQIAPGQPVTHDYRAARVTVETDCASGRVVRAACG